MSIVKCDMLNVFVACFYMELDTIALLTKEIYTCTLWPKMYVQTSLGTLISILHLQMYDMF